MSSYYCLQITWLEIPWWMLTQNGLNRDHLNGRNLRTQAHITGSTAYNAMGFRGFSQLCNHFREFVYKKQPTPVDEATQA